MNVAHVRKADLDQLAETFKLLPEDRASIQGTRHRSRLFVRPDYTYLVLTHPVYDASLHKVVTKELDVLLTSSMIATVHHAHVPAVSAFYDEVAESKKHDAMKHPAAVLAHVVSLLTIDVYEMLEAIAGRLDTIEQHVYENKPNLLQDIVTVQTNLIDVEKALESRTAMLDRLLTSLSARPASYLQTAYDDLESHLNEIQASLDTEFKTAQTLHRAHETYLNTKTNKLIHLLTALSIIVMPATLLAGIFGMNARYPWILGADSDFAIIIGVMILSSILLWAILKRQR